MMTLMWSLHVLTNHDEYNEENEVTSNNESDNHLELGTSTD